MKKQREIQLSRKTLKNLIFLLVLLGLLGVGTLLLVRNPALLSGLLARFGPHTTTPIPALQPDAMAAEAAVSAFYTLDYTESSGDWQARVCALATASGCQFFQTLYAPTIRPLVEEHQIQTDCTAQAVRLVEDSDSRIWQVTARYDQSWQEGLVNPFTVYVQIVQENGVWLLDHVLLDWEAESFALTPTP